VERDVVFIVERSRGPKYDVTAERWQPALEIQVRFTYYAPHPKAYMQVSFVEEVYDDSGRPLRRTMHEERVLLEEPADVMLAQACLAADDKTASDIAYRLFWLHAVKPSFRLGDGGEPHWLCKHAPEWWHGMAKIFLRENEQECARVQEA